MTANYIMEDKNESLRLEKQSKQPNFSVQEEFKSLSLPKSGKYLDAGCGSGVVCNFINKVFPHIEMHGCDLTEDRLNFARLNAPKSKFFQADLTSLSSYGEQYECIINRYVAHHLSIDNYKQLLSEFKKSLNENGKLIIIDAEGALINIGSTNQELLSQLNQIKSSFPGNLNMARYIPSLLHDVGFREIDYQIRTMDFQGAHKLTEIEQYKERINFSQDFYIKALGSENEFEKFKELFFSEALKSPLFYNKFIITAYK